jgi:hypothetical protein
VLDDNMQARTPVEMIRRALSMIAPVAAGTPRDVQKAGDVELPIG